MNTFLGFATGLLGGIFIGIGMTAYVVLTDEDARKYFNESAEHLNS